MLAAAGGRFINLASLNLFLRLVRCRLRSQVFTSHSNGTRDPDSSDNEKGRPREASWSGNHQRELRESRIYGKPTWIFSLKIWNRTFARPFVVKNRYAQQSTKMTKSRDSVINIWSSRVSDNAWRLIKNSLLIVSIDLSTWLSRDKSHRIAKGDSLTCPDPTGPLRMLWVRTYCSTDPT